MWTPPKRLSIAHWKALGESYLLSHKSSSGGGGGGGGGSMKELWPLEENKYKRVNIALRKNFVAVKWSTDQCDSCPKLLDQT